MGGGVEVAVHGTWLRRSRGRSWCVGFVVIVDYRARETFEWQPHKGKWFEILSSFLKNSFCWGFRGRVMIFHHREPPSHMRARDGSWQLRRFLMKAFV